MDEIRRKHLVIEKCRKDTIAEKEFIFFDMTMVMEHSTQKYLCGVKRGEKETKWSIAFITKPIHSPDEYALAVFEELIDSYWFRSVMGEIEGDKKMKRVFTCRMIPGDNDAATTVYESVELDKTYLPAGE